MFRYYDNYYCLQDIINLNINITMFKINKATSPFNFITREDFA